MRIGLSSAAAPAASFDELLALCQRRGFAALELREQDAHGVERDRAFEAARFADAAGAAGVTITGFRPSAGDGSELRLARLGMALDTTILIRPEPDMRHAIERAGALRSVGARVGIVLGGDEAEEDLALLSLSTFEIAWDADPAHDGLGARAVRVLDRFATRLRHVQMIGGGPEATLHEGRGVGEVMTRLALTGYDGAVLLAPSAARFRVAWDAWLGRRGGWGCGSKSSDATLVNLDTPLKETNR